MNTREISDKLSHIEDRLDRIDENLDRHMKRSDALEEQVKPIQKLMLELHGAINFLKIIGVVAALVESIRVVFF